jgi:hypothetical protein
VATLRPCCPDAHARPIWKASLSLSSVFDEAQLSLPLLALEKRIRPSCGLVGLLNVGNAKGTMSH